MLENTTVFNSTFEKILSYLNVDFREITSETKLVDEIIMKAPDRIKVSISRLMEYAEQNESNIYLISNDKRRPFMPMTEWLFAIFSQDDSLDASFRVIRQELIDHSYPYHIDIIYLNRSPAWLIDSIKRRLLKISGSADDEIISKIGGNI